MSWVRIYVHLVFSTKKREQFLDTIDLRKAVFQHIKENALQRKINLDCINGYTDHVHCLIALDNTQTISKVAQLIKGESSNWINKNELTTNYFAWQDDYWAVGVSESHLEKLRKYINNQEEHHSKTSFTDEMDNFLAKYDSEFEPEV